MGWPAALCGQRGRHLKSGGSNYPTIPLCHESCIQTYRRPQEEVQYTTFTFLQALPTVLCIQFPWKKQMTGSFPPENLTRKFETSSPPGARAPLRGPTDDRLVVAPLAATFTLLHAINMQKHLIKISSNFQEKRLKLVPN